MGREALLEICELFYSLQGESSYAGYPCFFIRVAGCNLRCTYCDTRYAYAGKHQTYSISQILVELANYNGVLIEITGGEPLLQEGIYPLMMQLLAAGRTVLVETNGSLSLESIPRGVVKIMDMKCPGSGMHDKMNFDNFAFMESKDEIKFVICSREDYKWAAEIVRTHELQRQTTITFSPVASVLPPASLADWILTDRLPVRLRLQLHTILWPGKTRGY